MIGKHSNRHAHPYSLAGSELEDVVIEKDPSVLIDSELTFEEHISKKVNKAHSMLGVIRRMIENLSPKIFCIYTLPLFDLTENTLSQYGHLKYVNLIEGVQRCATRLVHRY